MQKHKVRGLSAFDSVLTDRFNDESDVDFVVDFAAMDIAEYAENFEYAGTSQPVAGTRNRPFRR